MRNRLTKKIIFIVILLITSYLGLGTILLVRSSDQNIIVMATTNSFRLPYFLTMYYALNLREFDVKAKNETGQTLLAFTLAGYTSTESLEDGRQADIFAIAEMLLRRGIDINATDTLGLTALHTGVLVNSLNEVRFLVNHGANLNSKAGDGPYLGLTPLEIAMDLERRQPHSRTEIIALLQDTQR